MLFNITYSFLFFTLVFLFLRYSKFAKIEGLNKWDLAIAFSIKSLASIVFIYIFTYYYGIGYLYYDSGMYISDAKILNQVFYDSPIDYFKLLSGIGENKELVEFHLKGTAIWSQPNSILRDDAKNIIRINSVIHFFSFNNIYIHFIIFNLLSFFGILQIFLYFKKFIKTNKRIFFFTLILLPSFLFWGSGVLKEPMVIFSYGVLFWVLRKPFKQKIVNFFLLILSICLILNFKAYVLASLFLPILFLISAKHLFVKFNIYAILVIQVLTIIASFFILPQQWQHFTDSVTVKQFDFNNITKGGVYLQNSTGEFSYHVPINQYKNIVQEKDSIFFVKNSLVYQMPRGNRKGLKLVTLNADSLTKFKISSIWTKSNSYLEPKLILYSEKQLIKNIPISLCNSLLRPFWNDPSPKFKIFLILETWLLFGFLIFAFFFRRKLSRNEQILLITLIQFVIILSLFIGWTTPVLGAIVRYRIFTYLIILIISFILIKPFNEWKTKKNIS